MCAMWCALQQHRSRRLLASAMTVVRRCVLLQSLGSESGGERRTRRMVAESAVAVLSCSDVTHSRENQKRTEKAALAINQCDNSNCERIKREQLRPPCLLFLCSTSPRYYSSSVVHRLYVYHIQSTTRLPLTRSLLSTIGSLFSTLFFLLSFVSLLLSPGILVPSFVLSSCAIAQFHSRALRVCCACFVRLLLSFCESCSINRLDTQLVCCPSALPLRCVRRSLSLPSRFFLHFLAVIAPNSLDRSHCPIGRPSASRVSAIVLLSLYCTYRFSCYLSLFISISSPVVSSSSAPSLL